MTSTDQPPADLTEAPTAEVASAGQQVLEMFVAICHAPDDRAVAAQADQALARLQALLDAA